ncbi:etoposide-induced protein 2.4 homolog [Ornithodoros turicata]|uniref:etoposide-induced protein 2.4 homolog n=1 Tax=Ornithodoros turicata TaxID=34597 RepID=UPI003139CFCD
MDCFKSLTYGLLRGIYDSFFGIAILKDLDSHAPKSDASSSSTKGSVENSTGHQETTLSRRRSSARQGNPNTTGNSEPKVRHRIFQCCVLNGAVFGLSIVAFNYVLLPCVYFLITLLFGGSQSTKAIWGWLQPLLLYTFQTLWVLPLFVLSKVVNSLWFQDIADLAYRQIRGRPPQLLPSLSRMLADTLFSILVQALFLIQSQLVAILPIGYLSDIVSLLHFSLLYSLYAFEYTWFNMGWELHRRLSFIEENWPYFAGFGLPLALATSWPSSYFISGCFFSILFPLYIISGHEAVPVAGTAVFRLQLFSPSIWVSNAIFRHLTNSSATNFTPQDKVHSMKRRSKKSAVPIQ